jgi:hypothetical protein
VFPVTSAVEVFAGGSEIKFLASSLSGGRDRRGFATKDRLREGQPKFEGMAGNGEGGLTVLGLMVERDAK